MSEPIVFISHNRVKEGKLDDFKQAYQKAAKLMEANKPGTIAFLAYVNEDGTEVSIVHVFPEADSMDLHMQGVAERVKETAEFLESDRLEIYGTPSDPVLAMMRQVAGSGVALSVTSEHLGGFIRLKSG
jgi:quinol monooxygenase YgiN